MALCIKILGVLEAVLGATRVIFDFLNFVPAAKCVYEGHILEKCPYNNLPLSLIVIGAAMEAFNSLALLMALFLWGRFYVKKYVLALYCVGHFWVWFILCVIYVYSNFVVESVAAARDGGGQLSFLGVFGVLEMISLTFLAAAINFVARETYQFWIEQKINSRRWRGFFDFVYCFTLFTYLLRNAGMFLYDSALVSMSISIIKGTTTTTGQWNSLLLVLVTAFRGSFVKFFFAKIFQGQDLPKVCDNIVENRPQPQENGYNILDASSSQEPTSIQVQSNALPFDQHS